MSTPRRTQEDPQAGLTVALMLMVVPSILLVGAEPGIEQGLLLGLVAGGMVMALVFGR